MPTIGAQSLALGSLYIDWMALTLNSSLLLHTAGPNEARPPTRSPRRLRPAAWARLRKGRLPRPFRMQCTYAAPRAAARRCAPPASGALSCRSGLGGAQAAVLRRMRPLAFLDGMPGFVFSQYPNRQRQDALVSPPPLLPTSPLPANDTAPRARPTHEAALGPPPRRVSSISAHRQVSFPSFLRLAGGALPSVDAISVRHIYFRLREGIGRAERTALKDRLRVLGARHACGLQDVEVPCRAPTARINPDCFDATEISPIGWIR